MPFLEHLDELRRRLFVVIGVLMVGAVGLYFYTDPIYRFVIEPVSFLLEDEKAITLRVMEAMTLRFKLALWAAAIGGSPIIIYQALAFFLPALRPKEQKWFIPTFIAVALLFFAGVAFCYGLVLAPAFEWLVDQNAALFRFVPQGGDLLFAVLYFLLGFGIAFQTPVVVFYLVYFGVIPYKTLRENWRVAWVVIVVVAAMATPDWSPVSMGALAIAMVVLYETSLLLVRVLLSRKIRAQQLELGAE